MGCQFLHSPMEWCHVSISMRGEGFVFHRSTSEKKYCYSRISEFMPICFLSVCLTLANTVHPQQVVWDSNLACPNGQVHNQIDFILTPQRFKSSIKKAGTRSFPGADIFSGNDLMLTTIKLKLKTKRFTKSPRTQFDLNSKTRK